MRAERRLQQDRPIARTSCDATEPQAIVPAMEFLNFLIILCAAWLVWRRPERERLAFRLLIASCVLMALLFLIGTHTSLVPGVNL
jgi:heme A synthase